MYVNIARKISQAYGRSRSTAWNLPGITEFELQFDDQQTTRPGAKDQDGSGTP